MDDNTFITLLKERLSPEPYSEIVDSRDGISALLSRPSFAGSRYVLAVAPWQEAADPISQFGVLRRNVDALFDASLFRGVGLIVLWYGPQVSWHTAAQELSPDKHGLRSTIVQGIVFLDLHTGQSHLSRTAWGPIKFGNFQGQFTRLQTLLNELERTQPQDQLDQ